MPRKLLEITATVARELQRFGDAPPYKLVMEGTMDTMPANDGANGDGHSNGNGRSSRIKLVGKSEGGEWGETPMAERGLNNRLEPYEHGSYRFYGEWRNYRNRHTNRDEKQFHWQTFVPAKPHSRAGVVAYLEQAPNIGRILAGRLFDRFGGKAVDILADQPEVASAAVDRLSDEAAAEASVWLKREESLRDCTIELVELLEGRGFPKVTVKAAVKEFGNRAADIIKANPYTVMRFRGCGFKRADALYLDLGHPAGKLKRQALCAWHHVARGGEGDTWLYRRAVEVGLAGAIAGADVKVDQAIELATRSGMLAVQWTAGADGPMDWDGTHCWIAEGKKARNEAKLAGYVVEALEDQIAWPDIESLRDKISPHQFEKLSVALSTPLGVLSGGPGCGKTYVAAKLVEMLGEIFGLSQIAAACPTGKASVRLTEAMQGYGVSLVARTIHSLLKVESGGDDGWSFAFNRANPLPFKVLIIDEASMIDTDLAASLFAARARGTLVLIIGDTGQLPPVGHGAPLRDMLAAGVPHGELTEIHRNEGGIVQACKDIHEGRPFKCEGNLGLAHASDAKSQKDEMLDAISTRARAFGVDPVWGVQVLCAVNKKSEVSRRDLNHLLQMHLNPNPVVAGSPFRLRDKVICTKNSWLPLVEVAGKTADGRVTLVDNDENLTVNDKNQVYVANGELGEVIKVEPNYLHVQLTAPRRLVVVPRGKQQFNNGDAAGDEDGNVEESSNTGCDWDLGYAISVHKAQGSEVDVAIVMIDESGGAKRVCSREWLRTAISRAKRNCILIGKLSVAQGFCRRTAIDKRRTFLAEKIKEGMVKL